VKRVAILQSNFLPWRGYFEIVKNVDEFIFHDDLQYTKGDWRNRNKFRTPNGIKWLSVPVGASENRLINEVRYSDNNWKKDHKRKILEWYSNARFYEYGKEALHEIFQMDCNGYLSNFNQNSIKFIAQNYFGITTKFSNSTQYAYKAEKNLKIINILRAANATNYVSGPAAKAYLDESLFLDNNILVEWVSYENMPIYYQPYTTFDAKVSILDLMFSTGEKSKDYLRVF
jgi:hypothetical protein